LEFNIFAKTEAGVKLRSRVDST